MRFVGCIAFVLVGFGFSATAQHEFSNWTWTDSNYITWIDDTAEVLNNGPVTAGTGEHEFSASISDRYGNLKVSALGFNVFNGQGNLMTNSSSVPYTPGFSANTILCPVPCHDSLYYLFICTHLPSTDTTWKWLAFTVNVNANGGQGEVTGPQILDSLHMQAGDVCRHGNNKDFWLVTRGGDNQTFKAWQITDNGILPPVVSITYGLPVPTRFNDYMDISPNAKWIATSTTTVPYSYSSNFEDHRLFKFDDLLGTVAHFCPLLGSSTNALYWDGNNYSCCFSADNSKVYMIAREKALWQFDLSSGIDTVIDSSGITIIGYANNTDKWILDLQLANDGKIYITRSGYNTASSYLAVINNPNDSGPACNYQLNGMATNQRTRRGLPKMIHNIYIHRTIQRDSLECTDDTTIFGFDDYRYFDSASWYIDTGAAQVSVTSDSLVYHVFDSAGVYPIMAVSYSGCRLDTFYDTVTVLLTPAPDLGPDTILCEGDTIQISNEWQYSYLWNTGDTTELIQVMVPDTYWLQLSNYCGSATDTVLVDSIIEALVIFPTDDTLLCDGDVLHLSAEVDAGTYSWFDGTTDSINDITATDTVWATAENACGISSDTIWVEFTDVPELPNLDNVICLGDTLALELETDSLSTFLWYNGDTTSHDSIWSASSNYWVIETNLCGADTDTFRLATVTDPIAFIGNDTGMCIGDSIVLDASTPFGTYSWQDASTDSIFGVGASLLAPGSNYFHVTVTNACGSDIDSILIDAAVALQIHLGKDDTVCVDDSISFSVPQFARATYRWDASTAYFSYNTAYKDSAKIEATTRKPTDEHGVHVQLDITNSCGVFSDSKTVFIDEPFTPKLPNKVDVCHGDSLQIHAGFAHRVFYTWSVPGLSYDSSQTDLSNSTFSTKARHPITNTNDQGFAQFWVEATNACGAMTDSVFVRIDSLPKRYPLDTVRFCRDAYIEVSVDHPSIDSLWWSDGVNSKERIIDQNATFLLTYFNQCGQTNDTLTGVRVNPPAFRYESPVLLCEDPIIIEPSFYDPTNDDYYPVYFLWNNGNQVPWLTVDEIGTYSVVATNSAGCKDSATVVVNTCGPDFYTANTFTPNDDPYNAHWKPLGEGLFEFSCTIYDRWGNDIITFDHNSLGWDGTITGYPAPQGVYYWKMDVISEDFTGQNTFEGIVNVVR